MTAIYPDVIDVFRGERTGWNPMFIIPSQKVKASRIEKKFLFPYVKSPTEFETLEFGGTYNNYLFVCDKPQTDLKKDSTGANNWIKKFQNANNKNGTETIQSACIKYFHQQFMIE